MISRPDIFLRNKRMPPGYIVGVSKTRTLHSMTVPFHKDQIANLRLLEETTVRKLVSYPVYFRKLGSNWNYRHHGSQNGLEVDADAIRNAVLHYKVGRRPSRGFWLHY